MDLSMVYWEDLESYTRTVALNGDDSVLTVKDILQAREKPASVRWAMCTLADAEIVDASTIRLSKNGRSRIMKVTVDGADPQLAIWPAGPVNDYDYPNPDNLMVGFTLDLPSSGIAGIKVELIKE